MLNEGTDDRKWFEYLKSTVQKICYTPNSAVYTSVYSMYRLVYNTCIGTVILTETHVILQTQNNHKYNGTYTYVIHMCITQV